MDNLEFNSIRRIDLGSIDQNTGEYLVKLANFDKLASDPSISSFIATFKPDPNYVYIHVIAIGGGEYYGCNQNADYFPERVLKDRHTTFERFAKVFKEHDNRPSSPSFGIVPKSWYNEEMHRVELILGIDKQKAPDLVKRIENGEILEVSMGAKVPYDICSICGHKATPQQGYCDHVKYEKRKIYNDGKQVYMINVQPTFFDISIVKKRADKVAFMLAKVASDNSKEDLPHIGNSPEENKKENTLIKRLPSIATTDILQKNLEKIVPILDKVEPDIAPEILNEMADSASLEDILRSFILNMVPLKPKEFAHIVIRKYGLPKESFSEIVDTAQTSEPDASVDFNISTKVAHTKIAELLEPYLPYRSSYIPFLTDRVNLLKEANFNPSSILPFRLSPTGAAVNYQYPGEGPLGNVPAGTNVSMNYTQPPLREPMSPIAVLAMLGGIYAASRSATTIHKLLGALNKTASYSLKDELAIRSGNFSSFDSPEFDDLCSGLYKTSSLGSFAKYYVAPFAGVHLLSSHYKRKYYEGQPLNAVEKYVAESPDLLSLAAPFAANFAKKRFGGAMAAMNSASKATVTTKAAPGALGALPIKPPNYTVTPGITGIKKEPMNMDTFKSFMQDKKNKLNMGINKFKERNAGDPELFSKSAAFETLLTDTEKNSLNKFASSWGDVAADSFVQSIIFPGRGISGANALLGAVGDQLFFKQIGKAAVGNKPAPVKTTQETFSTKGEGPKIKVIEKNDI